LAEGAEQGRAINWHLVEQFVELNPAAASPPRTKHGTHVAGIIGASAEGAREKARAVKEAQEGGGGSSDKAVNVETSDWTDGMCPDINIWDLRVLAPTLKETEFAIIAALQFVRYVNERYSFMTIHGANLSLSIPHDVRNFACGRTPVCNECERLVNSGVVVVAAAGNRGYQNFETSEGQFEGYAAFSVTDPGNADGVITVGATHRYWPHTYGVSFFSSRGPTGDGRLKPDLVAPGEKIRGPLPGNTWGDLDGTSMAAPHVSGAAAMLMARYSELVGQPRRIKTIVSESATDLGREKSFQGHGMLDVLRAFQSI
jgi:subtilisin family serine protease